METSLYVQIAVHVPQMEGDIHNDRTANEQSEGLQEVDRIDQYDLVQGHAAGLRKCMWLQLSLLAASRQKFSGAAPSHAPPQNTHTSVARIGREETSLRVCHMLEYQI